MNERRLTKLEKAWLKHYLAGEDATNAARLAGYKDADASGYDLKRRLKPILEEHLEAAGVTDALVAKVLRDAMSATKVITAVFNGEITDEREYTDHGTRMSAVDRYLKITGKAAPDKREITGKDGTALIPADITSRLPEDVMDARLAELEDRDDTNDRK